MHYFWSLFYYTSVFSRITGCHSRCWLGYISWKCFCKTIQSLYSGWWPCSTSTPVKILGFSLYSDLWLKSKHIYSLLTILMFVVEHKCLAGAVDFFCHQCRIVNRQKWKKMLFFIDICFLRFYLVIFWFPLPCRQTLQRKRHGDDYFICLWIYTFFVYHHLAEQACYPFVVSVYISDPDRELICFKVSRHLHIYSSL